MKKSEEELTSEKGCVGHLVGEAHVDVPDAGCPVDLEDTLLPGEM
jgi:malate dehydrogenase (NADP+)